MISMEDQETLFQLISRYLKKDITGYAFGGNAMMYYGYKTATKDIDILFETEEEKQELINAITELGYKKMSLLSVYLPILAQEKIKPEMYTRGDERFDIFLKKIFQTQLSDTMKKRFFARHDYITEQYTLTVYVLSKEDIIFLKSITRRERDFDDIKAITEKESNINWDVIIDEALFQAQHGDGWAIFDLEETMQRLKKFIFIKHEYFERLYSGRSTNQ